MAQVAPMREPGVTDKDAVMTPILVPDEDGEARLATSLSGGDAIALVIMLALLPFVLLTFFLGIALFAPGLLVLGAYKDCCLASPLDRVPRTCGFYAVEALVALLWLPFSALALLNLVVTEVVTLAVSVPVGVCRCGRTAASWRALWRYRRGAGDYAKKGEPEVCDGDKLAQKYGYCWPFSDLVAAFIGGLDRQGFCEFVIAVPQMVAVVPAVKHTIVNNPFLYRLQEVYVNQWTPPLDPDGDGEFLYDLDDRATFRETIQAQVCRSLLRERNRAHTDTWPFAGHHQYPPPARPSKTVAGLQFSKAGPGRWTLISHTTLGFLVPGNLPRSRYAAWNLLRVHLLWYNPWYIISGYVEVNVRKDSGLEHPMWLIADPSSKLHCAVLNAINQIFVATGNSFAEYIRLQPGVLAGPPTARAAPQPEPEATGPVGDSAKDPGS